MRASRSGPPTGGEARRSPRRLPHLPSGRALIGALLVVAAAGGVLMSHRSATQAPLEQYLVASQPLAAGITLSAGDLGAVALDLPDDMGALNAERADEVLGRVLRHDLAELELLRPGDVLDRNRFSVPGQLEVVLDLPPARALWGTVSAGDQVDVLVTDPTGSGTTTLTRTTVVAIDGHDGDGIGARTSVQVRVAADDRTTAEQLVDAALRTELTLVLPAPGEPGNAP